MNNTPTRAFALAQIDNPTKVNVAEFQDGSISVMLISQRENMEPLTTGFRLSARTFHLLSDALSRAAHDPLVWQPITLENAKEYK